METHLTLAVTSKRFCLCNYFFPWLWSVTVFLVKMVGPAVNCVSCVLLTRWVLERCFVCSDFDTLWFKDCWVKSGKHPCLWCQDLTTLWLETYWPGDLTTITLKSFSSWMQNAENVVQKRKKRYVQSSKKISRISAGVNNYLLQTKP